MKLSIFLTSLLFFTFCFAAERQLYVGQNSTEAIIAFRGIVQIESARKPTPRKINEHVENQVVHLFGPMAVASYKAVPKGNHKVTNISIAKTAVGLWTIEYDYVGTIVLENGPTNSYEVILPVNPSTIYAAGKVGRKNTCTDEHYQSEGDFWYFWNPNKYGCNLKENIDYLVIPASVSRVPNTVQTYPEYQRLVDSSGRIKMTLLMGMDEPKRAKDPNISADINAGNFQVIKQRLLSDSWQSRELTKQEVADIVQEAVRMPYVERFTKVVSNGSKNTELVLDVFFGPSGIGEDSAAFHYFFKDAIENSSIMMYAGHSGLGGHLDLASIEDSRGFRFQPSTSKYQIYFFNSCTSYTYYNTMYFDRKKSPQDPAGTKNLDIFTNGLATYFSVMPSTNLAVVNAVEMWASGRAVVSYQTLASTIDSDNLFGISGDEDNPRR